MCNYISKPLSNPENFLLNCIPVEMKKWEFLEIFSSTLSPFPAISLFFFTSMCSTWFLFSSRFIEVSSCPFVLSPIFLYFIIFGFLWAFTKKSVVTFSEYELGGREQCHKKVYKQENLQQIPFENNTQTLVVRSIRLLFSFFRARSLELTLYSYPTAIARILRLIVWT